MTREKKNFLLKMVVLLRLGKQHRFKELLRQTREEGGGGGRERSRRRAASFCQSTGERFSIWEPQRLASDPRHRRSGLSRRWHAGLLRQGSTTLRNDGRALRRSS